jgi:hypothetical protein
VNTAKGQRGPQTPPEVPAKATRSGSSRWLQWGTLRLPHDSALIWTERMLEALERGNDNRQYPNVWLTERGLILLSSITHGTATGPAK